MLTREDSLNLYYQHDGHLNPQGYDFFAREIARALQD
jgi:lysophospholipase L1-like esterase